MITPLEFATVGFTLMTVAMYFFWFHKPLDVTYPVIIRCQPPQGHTKVASDDDGSVSEKGPVVGPFTPLSKDSTNKEEHVQDFEVAEMDEKAKPATHSIGPAHVRSLASEGVIDRVGHQDRVMDDMGLSTTVPSGDPHSPVIERGRDSIIRVNSGRNRGSSLIHALRGRINMTAQDLEQLFKDLKTMTGHSVQVVKAKKIPYPLLIFIIPFFTPVNVTINIAWHLTDTWWHTESSCPKVEKNVVQENLTFAVAVVSATVFGLIHCRAWSHQEFPTAKGRIFLHAASLAITCIPTLSFAAWLLCEKWKHWITKHIKAICESLLPPLYLAPRVILLVIAFTSLRDLPSRAYEIVPWTEFIPHF